MEPENLNSVIGPSQWSQWIAASENAFQQAEYKVNGESIGRMNNYVIWPGILRSQMMDWRILHLVPRARNLTGFAPQLPGAVPDYLE
jgi:hypothetical protein